MRLIYLTHPQVTIDPDVPVPSWDLSPVGMDRVRGVLPAPWLSGITKIVSSEETKATTTAAMIGDKLGLTPVHHADMGENDRSSTGFLPGPEFEAMADAFFANPGLRVKGWESAQEAQTRIVAAVSREIAQHSKGDLLCVGHGAVGTLLMCHCAGWDISRTHDQPGGGGGNVFCASLPRMTLVHPWRSMEDGPA